MKRKVEISEGNPRAHTNRRHGRWKKLCVFFFSFSLESNNSAPLSVPSSTTGTGCFWGAMGRKGRQLSNSRSFFTTVKPQKKFRNLAKKKKNLFFRVTDSPISSNPSRPAQLRWKTNFLMKKKRPTIAQVTFATLQVFPHWRRHLHGWCLFQCFFLPRALRSYRWADAVVVVLLPQLSTMTLIESLREIWVWCNMVQSQSALPCPTFLTLSENLDKFNLALLCKSDGVKKNHSHKYLSLQILPIMCERSECFASFQCLFFFFKQHAGNEERSLQSRFYSLRLFIAFCQNFTATHTPLPPPPLPPPTYIHTYSTLPPPSTFQKLYPTFLFCFFFLSLSFFSWLFSPLLHCSPAHALIPPTSFGPRAKVAPFVPATSISRAREDNLSFSHKWRQMRVIFGPGVLKVLAALLLQLQHLCLSLTHT